MLEKEKYLVGGKAEMCLLIGIGCHKIYGVHKSTIIVVGFHIGSFFRTFYINDENIFTCSRL